MPAKAESRKVLDGRGEVLSYKRNPTQFFLRVYNSEKVGYDSHKIEHAYDLETACRYALDVYLEMQKTKDVTPKTRTLSESSQGDGLGKVLQRRRKSRLDDQVKLYLEEQERRVEAKLLHWRTLKNYKLSLQTFFLPYCESQGLIYTTDIKVGVLDDFPAHYSRLTRNSCKTYLTQTKKFLRHLARKKLLDPYEAALIDDIVPKIKIRQVDLSANPPFRDEAEWLRFVKVIHAWVKEADQFRNPRITYFRRKFWCFILVLKQTGARPAELLNLRWCDIETQDVGRISESQKQQDIQALNEQGIDPSELPVEVREALGRVPRYVTHLRILSSKTGVPREVSSNSAEVLARWKRFQLERLKYVKEKHSLWSVELTPDTKVFSSPVNNEWHQAGYNVFNDTWRELIKRAKPVLKGPLLSEHDYSIYSLRASRAMELLRLGVDVAIAAKSLGHSPSMMLRVYAQLPVREQSVKAAIAGIEYGKRKEDTRVVELDEIT